jgi:hypothetical protein
MPVLTVARAVEYLNINRETAGARLEALVGAVNAYLEDYCRRDFDLAVITDEYHDIPHAGTDTLWVDHPPIVTLTAVYDDPDNGNRSLSVATDIDVRGDYFKLYNTEGSFTTGTRAVKVQYTGGYSQATMPSNLILAACWVLAAWWSGDARLTRKYMNVDGQQMNFRDETIPPQAEAVLQRYRRVVG